MTVLVGILNLTPDSFSDGGRHVSPEAALAQAEHLLKAGAGLLDVGAESTRPGAIPISPEEEWARLAPSLPALLALTRAHGAELSLDTRHAETARRALPLGVDWINDVQGLDNDAMVEAVRDHACRLVIMHHLGVPVVPGVTLPPEADAVEVVVEALAARVATLEARGIARARLILDPGLGFGKSAAQSLDLLRRASAFRAVGLPVLIGHSRKSFLGGVPEGRDGATLAASLHLAQQGIEYLRVHDVANHAQGLAMAEVLHGAG